MLASHNIIQQYRLVRLLMLVIIVGLTIFLYTSYYANQTMQQLPSAQRLHMASLISVASDDTADNAIGISSNKLTANDVDTGTSLGLGSGIAAALDDSQTQTQQQLIGNSNSNNLLSKNDIDNSNNNKFVQQQIVGGEYNAQHCMAFDSRIISQFLDCFSWRWERIICAAAIFRFIIVIIASTVSISCRHITTKNHNK